MPSYQTPGDDGADVQLTIDEQVQCMAEGVAASMMTSGAVVILDVETGEVRGCVSVPDYLPDNVQGSISEQGAPLLNRAFSAYAVGSVFKPVLAAAALETGNSGVQYTCEGYIRINDHIYRCAGSVPHGNVTLQKALEKSCNGYFITLGAVLGPQTLYDAAESYGFGQPIYIAGGLKTASGVLPETESLENLGEKANFSFGQGMLTATPVQIAAMMNAIAAGGEYRTPKFVSRIYDADTNETIETIPSAEARRVMTTENAKTLQTMLAGVVSDGIGKEAKPYLYSAAGKTGTAQTGRYNAEKKEYKNLWFAGFYPADAPQYTIAVLQDEQTNAENSSAAIFARLCDGLELLGKVGQ